MNILIKKIKTDYPEVNVLSRDDSLFVIKKNWNYLNCLEFQNYCAELIYKEEFKKYSIFIMTSHEPCFTLGRGIQKNDEITTNLIDFDESLFDRLSLPVYKIKRGGGITFHHPDQFILYPIINLSFHGLKVYGLINNIMKVLVDLIKCNFNVELDYCRPLLGLWAGDKKIASVGIQLRRFVSFHGVALNLKSNLLIKKDLSIVYPCGLPGGVYSSIYDLTKEELSFDILVDKFIKTSKECFSPFCSKKNLTEAPQV